MNVMTQAPAVDGQLSLVVRQIRAEADGINSYEFVDASGAALPAFTAGAHIDVHLPGGITRQYSLSNDPAETHRYVIAVLHDPRGRGGSSAVHEHLRVRGRVTVSAPRNHFPLHDGDGHVVLVAGGIGVTPIKSMAHALAAAGRSFELHYCAKSSDHSAFAQELEALANGRSSFHYDGGDPSKSLDIAALLAERKAEGVHVYYCGPGGFMSACAEATSGWTDGTVHCEHFKAPAPKVAPVGETDAGDGSYTAVVQSTGANIEVAPGQSLVDALADAGVVVETSCVAGLCGSCKTRYLSGDVEHNDYILDAGDQAQYLTACVSRGRPGTTLVLDL